MSNELVTLLGNIAKASTAAKRAPLPPTDIEKARDEMVRRLSAMKLHTVYGVAGPEDAASFRENLEDIWGIIDTFIEEFGNCCNCALGGVDVSLFRAQLRGALEGNASYELERVKERIEEDFREYM